MERGCGMTATEIAAMSGKLSRFLGQFDEHFVTCRGRAHLQTYVEGQLGPLERKSIEPIADAAGVNSRTLQEFLTILRWKESGVRDQVQAIVARKYHGRECIVIVDESGYPKKGTATACVQRQYCGATGKVDNCVIGIHLGFASDDFHTLIDADLYLPQSWHADAERRRKARIPAEASYRPMHTIALGQIERARESGVPINWVIADERYGGVPAFMAQLESWGHSYVLEVPKSLSGWTRRPEVWETSTHGGDAAAGLRVFPRLAEDAPAPKKVENLVAHGHVFTHQPWIPFRIKDTLKGPDVWEVKSHAFFQHRDGLPSRPLTLLALRNVLDDTRKYFVAFAPEGASLETLLRIAFNRWRIERCFEDSKGEIGMDHFEVRGWRTIHRHLYLSLVSHLFLAEQKERLRGEKSEHHGLSASDRDALRA